MNLLQQQPGPATSASWRTPSSAPWSSPRSPKSREQDFTLKSRNGIPGSRCLEDVEKDHILRVLEDCGGNQTRAAEVLGIDRVTLHHKLKKYGWNRKEREKEMAGVE